MTDNAKLSQKPNERPGKRPTNGAKGAPIKNIDLATVKRLLTYFKGYRVKYGCKCFFIAVPEISY